jgi:hypothetical protein
MFEFVTRYRPWVLTIAATADVAMVSAVIYFGWHYINCGV